MGLYGRYQVGRPGRGSPDSIATWQGTSVSTASLRQEGFQLPGRAWELKQGAVPHAMDLWEDHEVSKYDVKTPRVLTDRKEEMLFLLRLRRGYHRAHL